MRGWRQLRRASALTLPRQRPHRRLRNSRRRHPRQPTRLPKRVTKTRSQNRRMSRWNEFDGKWASIRFGWVICMTTAPSPGRASKEQIPPRDEAKLRDFRILFKGRLKFVGRRVTWTAGIMYDNANEEWVMRQTGISFETPGITGSIFFGRTKKGSRCPRSWWATQLGRRAHADE